MVVDAGPQVPEEYLYKVVDALDEVAKETGKTVPQIALNWLLRRPTVSTLIIGARNEEQLRGEPRRGRLEADAGAGREARCGQRAAAGVSLLAPGAVRRAQPIAGLNVAHNSLPLYGFVLTGKETSKRFSPLEMSSERAL